jgi:uncharacterized protein (DUF1330 family)
MAVYMIADIKITDNKWVPAYAASVHELVHKHGGKYLSRSGNVETLEGTPLDTNLIVDSVSVDTGRQKLPRRS